VKIQADKYLYNEALKYLGRYPATKKKIKEYLKKKIQNKRTYQKVIYSENIDKNLLVDDILFKLDELGIIDESSYLESMFNYYQQSLFSIRKIKNKLFLKGFDQNKIDEFIELQLQENPEMEIDIIKKYIIKKKLNGLEETALKKKLYQQCFSENSIFRVIKD
jgi:SOS response regulatory protein OraA/RecX